MHDGQDLKYSLGFFHIYVLCLLVFTLSHGHTAIHTHNGHGCTEHNTEDRLLLYDVTTEV